MGIELLQVLKKVKYLMKKYCQLKKLKTVYIFYVLTLEFIYMIHTPLTKYPKKTVYHQPIFGTTEFRI